MQTTRRRIRAAAELAPRMQLREHHFDRRNLAFGMTADGNAAAVVADLHRPVAVQSDIHLGREARRGLIDGIVDQFPHEVHEPCATGTADVHARPFAHGLQALKGFDRISVVNG